MAVLIREVVPKSPAARKGIKRGETLISINGKEIRDVLDYRFYMVDKVLKLSLLSGGAQRMVKVRKGEYEELGLEFDTYLMDKQKGCRNGCVFCFVDQLPQGMRESLYFKDDDSRMSFLFGNYITLTNMTDEDIDRIIEMHISPVNISVHTMNPELRVRMMKNKHSGDALRFLKRLAEAGIKLNTQLVLCPGINDGNELLYSLDELGKLYPSVQSIACVPVGLTRFRKGLEALRMYTQEEAGKTVDQIEDFSNTFFQMHREYLAMPADEFYIKAGRPLPEYGRYGDFSQLENGVGLVSLLESEFEAALEDYVPKGLNHKISWATGVDAAPFMEKLAVQFLEKEPGVEIGIHPIRNDYFGETITVAGLVTGGDLIAQLKGKKLGKKLLIPSVMLRKEGDLFLDGVSLEDVRRELDVPVHPVENDGYGLLEQLYTEG